MKKYVSLFIIVLCFLFSLSIGTGSDSSRPALFVQNQKVINSVEENFGITMNAVEHENTIVSSNSQNVEIYSALNDRKNFSYNENSGESTALNKLLKSYLFSSYKSIYRSISHKISPYLKNEICTRAP